MEKYLNKVIQGDCLEVMKDMPDKSVDLVLTDPPYGIRADSHPIKSKFRYGKTNWDNERPKKEIFDEIFRISKNQIIWGGNYFTDFLYPSMGWLVWDKGRNFSLADGELAWTSFQNALRIKSISRAKALVDGKVHPTQKSLDIILWCIKWAEERTGYELKTIFDPFLGSGTTALAAEMLNRKWIGCEISEKYCEIADRRIKDYLKQPKLL
jgi:site-specific DNA-methyltransferase (adenine-specific)